MEASDKGSTVSKLMEHNVSHGRTPLRQILRRKRTSGKRTVPSCASCRAAHVRCVADRYGVPCARCAKKAWKDCTLVQIPQDRVPAQSTRPSDQVRSESAPVDQNQTPNDDTCTTAESTYDNQALAWDVSSNETGETNAAFDGLQQIASETLALMAASTSK
ncbi:hypothetical protein F4777DRAFT_581546 [Nemania sp. FL0916]|nr:hypothetical protein F4777DRAFT_581546 [Nemania sp. FL0916]